jgi:hypothetical protein
VLGLWGPEANCHFPPIRRYHRFKTTTEGHWRKNQCQQQEGRGQLISSSNGNDDEGGESKTSQSKEA